LTEWCSVRDGGRGGEYVGSADQCGRRQSDHPVWSVDTDAHSVAVPRFDAARVAAAVRHSLQRCSSGAAAGHQHHRTAGTRCRRPSPVTAHLAHATHQRCHLQPAISRCRSAILAHGRSIAVDSSPPLL